MTITDFHNFDVLITRSGAQFRALLVDAPAGEASTRFELPFTAEEVTGFGGLALGLQQRGAGVTGNTDPAADLAALGGRLFEAVFGDELRARLAASLASTAEEGAGLRLRLRFEEDAADLALLPWEILYDQGQQQFVGLAEASPILRYLSLPRSRSALLVEPPLRVLAMLSSPTDLPPLEIDKEWQAVQEALAALVAAGKVTLERLARPTLTALQERLMGEQPVHILHVVGHGEAGRMLLEDGRGRSQPVRGEDLAALLRNHHAVRLVYLSACEGALSSGQSAFAGVAQALVRGGAPAAVAMQAEISDTGAIELARTFYTALAAGRPVDAALTQARAALSAAGSLEWAIPVLFSRSPDNRLFDLRQVLPTPECPYPGMVSFSEAQKDLFFGRDKEIEDAVERLRQHPFLAVMGPSGSGKSSLIYAGVIPALRTSRRFGPGEWVIRMMRPGPKPLAALTEALGVAADPLPTLPPRSGEPEGGRTLLFVDQFEETFTLAEAGEAQAFLDAIQALIGWPNLHILLTVRADFYPELMASSLWQPIRANRLELTPLGDNELWAAIVEPAARVGVEVDEALAVKLIADASGQKGVLPLVQETLVLLWDKVKGRRLKLEAYKEMGETGRSGLQVAIDRRATTVYHNLPDAAQPIARRIFLRLIQFGEGRADTRRQQIAAELRASGDDPALFDQTLAKLIEGRLLTASGDAEGAERRVDIAHEALIAGWPRLQAWLDQRRAAEQTRRRLEAKAAEWVAAKKRGGLLDEYELQDAEQWLAGEDGRELGYSPDLVDLVQASMDVIAQAVAEKEAQQQREMEQAQRLAEERRLRAEESEKATRSRRKRLIAATGAVIIAAIAFTAAAWFGVDASRQSDNAKAKGIEAEKAARSAQAEGLVGHTRAELAKPIPDYSLALMLAQEAISSTWKIDGYVLPNAERVLSDTIAAAPPWRMNLPPRRHDGPVTSVAFSFDGQTILTTSSDGTARIWDVATGQEQQRLMDPAEEISSAAFSPDGKQIVTGDRNGSIRLWDTATGQVVRQLGSHACNISFGTGGCAVGSVAFSPDGKFSLSSSVEKNVRVWDVAMGKEVRRFPANDWIDSAAYGPDGKSIIIATTNDSVAHILDATTGQEIRQLIGHTGSIQSIAYSPDRKHIITASADGTARIWDAATGQEMHQLVLPVPNGFEYVRSAFYSPDGRFIVTITEVDGTARVWDAATMQQIRQLRSFGCEVSGEFLLGCGVWSAAYSSDSQFIVTGNVDGTMHIWDATTGQEVRQIGGHGCIGSSCSVNSAAYSPDGKQIATTGDDGTARIWDAVTGQEVRQLRGHAGHVSSASYSPDGKQIVTTGCDKIEDGPCTASSARIWDADTGQEVRQLVGHSCGDVFYGCLIFSGAYSPDGKQIVTAAADQTARIWDAATGQEVRQLRGHTGSVRSATYSPDGLQIVTAGDDGTTRIWDAATGNELRQLAGQGCGDLDVPPPGCGISSAAYSPDGKQIVTANFEGTVHIWDAVTGQEIRQLRGHSAYVQTAAFSPDGKQIITTGGDGTARIWDATTGAQLRLLTEDTGRVLSAAFSPDGKSIVTAGCERIAGLDNCFAATVRVWDAAPKPEVTQLGGYGSAGFSSAVYSPNGQFIVTTVAFGSTVDIWNAITGKQILELPRHGCAEHNYCKVYAARYSPDGKQIVTAGGDRIAHIWDATTGKEIRQLRGHTSYVQSAAYSPDGKQIVTASGDNTARIWDASSGQEMHRLIGHTDAVISAAFSPNGETVVTASGDETARIWDVATGQPVHQLNGHRSWVRSAAYSSDGKFVVTASSDGTVRIWDAATGQEIRQIVSDLCKKNSVSCMIGAAIYSPDNRYIVIAEGAIANSTGIEDPTVRFFDAATGKEVRSLKGHGGSDGSIAFSTDGEHIVTASRNGAARIWVANIEDLLDKAQRLISRDPPLLTLDELRSYGLVEEVR